jgi:hypothetical protein
VFGGAEESTSTSPRCFVPLKCLPEAVLGVSVGFIPTCVLSIVQNVFSLTFRNKNVSFLVLPRE